MNQIRIPQWVFRLLVAGIFVLPVTICVLWAVSLLLGNMDDHGGERALRYVALAGGIVMVIDLICLVVAQAVNSLADTEDSE